MESVTNIYSSRDDSHGMSHIGRVCHNILSYYKKVFGYKLFKHYECLEELLNVVALFHDINDSKYTSVQIPLETLMSSRQLEIISKHDLTPKDLQACFDMSSFSKQFATPQRLEDLKLHSHIMSNLPWWETLGLLHAVAEDPMYILQPQECSRRAFKIYLSNCLIVADRIDAIGEIGIDRCLTYSLALAGSSKKQATFAQLSTAFERIKDHNEVKLKHLPWTMALPYRIQKKLYKRHDEAMRLFQQQFL